MIDTRPSRRTFSILIGALALLIMAPAARADDDRKFLLLSETLDIAPVTLIAIDDEIVTCRDETGVSRDVPTASCLALLRDNPPRIAAAESMLILANGQRLPGAPASDSSDAGDVFTWRHPWLGETSVTLDHIAALRLARAHPLPPAGESDVVILANGDRLDGFITRINGGITLEFDDPDAPALELPLDRIAACRFITPPVDRIGARLCFRDGTAIDGRGLRFGDDGFVHLDPFIARARPVPLSRRIDDVDAILLGGASHLVPLASLSLTDLTAPPTRYSAPPPTVSDDPAPLDLRPVAFSGPLTARYALPPNARRFAARVVMPPDAHELGDLELIIRIDDVERLRATINRSAPVLGVNLEAAGTVMTIELAPGLNGSINDRIVFERAMILTHTKQEEAPAMDASRTAG
jgi:hypothetical protein